MITPIEMYTMVPKSHEAATVRQGEVAKDNSQHINGMVQFGNDTVANSQKTLRMEQTDNPEYRYDGTGGNGPGYSGNRKKKEKREEASQKDEKGNVRPGGFDIRI